MGDSNVVSSTQSILLFYDTNALLNLQERCFNDKFVIAQKTLEEIEYIKTSSTKDTEIKFKARRVAHLLDEKFGSYNVVPYSEDVQTVLSDYGLETTPDNIILASARYYSDNEEPILFCTNDLNCKFMSKNVFLLPTIGINNTKYIEEVKSYTGYREIMLYDDSMSYLYSHMDENIFELLENEYLVVLDANEEVKDLLVWREGAHHYVKYPTIKSNYFGAVKPYDNDIYQRMVLNSLSSNQITMIKGAAGTGKSYLAIGYLMWLLEKRKIDTIVVFCNTVATINSAKLGFYPGSKNDKLLDSSIGNMLASKLGDAFGLEEMVAKGKIELIPMSDIRGYDTSGKNAGVYITEAQNMDISLMKLALQRVGEDSICIIEGDYNTQVDLSQYAGMNNGMRRMSEIFRGADFYGEVELKNIYRSKIAKMAELM